MVRLFMILLLCSAFALACEEEETQDSVQQTTQEALAELCSIPVELQSDPASVGPYLAKRISNPEVIQMLKTLDDPKGLHETLEKHGFNPQSCDLVAMLSKAD